MPQREKPNHRMVVLVDGQSGAGKTTLAHTLAAELGATLVSMDEFYPGWAGLAEASAMVASEVLTHGRWRVWDWDANRPGPWRSLSADAAVVVEGSGSITAESSRLALASIWVDAPRSERERRRAARDGGRFAEHLANWDAQELHHVLTNRPQELADLIVST